MRVWDSDMPGEYVARIFGLKILVDDVILI
jgi:hypothetical protein